VARRQGDDQLAMNDRVAAWQHDQPAVRLARECIDRTLNLGSIAHRFGFERVQPILGIGSPNVRFEVSAARRNIAAGRVHVRAAPRAFVRSLGKF
jgi:hypothetical protein